MGLLNKIKRFTQFVGDWFSDATDDKLITEYGFIRAYVEWDY